MRRRWAGLWGGLILSWAPLAALDASELLPAADLRAEAELAARHGTPLIVVFSRADCKFCQTVKRDYLQPLASDTRPAPRRVVVREIGQDRDTPLRDFAGRTTTQAAFAASQKIKLVPVVAFYGPNGRPLAEPIVGARLPDFYQSYLEDGIEQSRRNLNTP